MSKRFTVAILYGMAEGPKVGKKLRENLRENSLTEVSDIKNADIVIAHSGGVFEIPHKHNAKLVLLVGAPMWPGRSIASSLSEKLKLEKSLDKLGLAWPRKTAYNALYTLTRPVHHARLLRGLKRHKYPSAHNGERFVVIRNQQDTFMQQSAAMKLAEEKNWILMSLPGQHDDIWHNPKPYVNLLRALLDA